MYMDFNFELKWLWAGTREGDSLGHINRVGQYGYVHNDYEIICTHSYMYVLSTYNRCLAAMHHSVKTMQLLLHQGANPKQTTSRGNNMIHVLIAKASSEPEQNENTYISTMQWIRENVSEEVYSGLLLSENDEGLRPLELAAHLGTYWLFQFLFDTPEVYITKEVDHYLHKVQYFDVTDYVSGSRTDKSPVKITLYLEERKLSCQSTKDVLLQNPMQSWFKAVIAANTPFIILWFVFRFLWMIVLIAATNVGFYSYTCSSESMNATAACFQWTHMEEFIPGYHRCLFWAVSIIFTVHVIDDIIAIAKHICRRARWLNRNLHGKKETCVRYMFYIVLHSCCVFEFSTEIMFEYLIPHADSINTTNGLVAFGFVWSVLFFMQLLPNVGHYVIATQRMLSVFVEFSVIFGLFFLSYSFTMCAQFSIAYGFDFSSFRLAMYNSFLLMEDMYDLKTVPSMSMNAGVHLLHVTFVLMVSLLLLNFLVALLISSYEYVHEHRDLLLLVQRLSVAMAVEDKFVRYLGPFRKWLQRNYLVYEDGRVYVTRTVWAANHGLLN